MISSEPGFRPVIWEMNGTVTPFGSAVRGDTPHGRELQAPNRLSRLLARGAALLAVLTVSTVEPSATTAQVRPDALDGLDMANAVAVSPDGAHAYVAAGNFNFLGNLVVFVRDSMSAALTFVESLPADGRLHDVTLSPDGAFVYAAGRDGVSIFGRDEITGALTLVAEESLGGSQAVTMSPGAAHLYIVHGDSQTGFVSVFSRNAITGGVTFIENHFAGDSPASVTVSADGSNVYTVSRFRVTVFSRDAGTGGLTSVQVQPIGDGTSAALSPDGAHVYVANDPGIILYSRAPVTGELTPVDQTSSGGPTGTGSLAVTSDGGHVYFARGDTVRIFSRNPSTGELTLVRAIGETTSPLVEGLQDASDVTPSPDESHVYVTAQLSGAVTTFSRDSGTGDLTFVETQMGRVESLGDAKVKIRNTVPDDPERNKGTWKARARGMPRPAIDSSDAPICNGDPPGTVKASIRFFSESSGHDTGALPLPCQNWLATDSEQQPGTEVNPQYRYADGRLELGPCKKVRVLQRAGSGLDRFSASCFGRGTTTDFDYDLVPGTDEVRVTVVLRLGRWAFFTSVNPRDDKNGSDGRAFVGGR